MSTKYNYAIILLIIKILINNVIFAQNFTISGFVNDIDNKEEIIGANIYILEKNSGTVSSNFGFFSLSLKKGIYNLQISYVGYKTKNITVELNKNISLKIELEHLEVITEEVTIRDKRNNTQIADIQMSINQLSIKTIRQIPIIFGEVDILKTIQLLPGVKSGGEGNSNFYVRGGGPDQNLILLDDAIVYNAFHLFGFFSIFNPDAVKDINLIKGGIPANYGNRLSSVLEISLKNGNLQKTKAQGGLGFISSRLTIEGPLKKDTSSFIFSARRTYIDLIIRPLIKKNNQYKGSAYNFYDLNFKINYKFSRKDRLYLSAYNGRDLFSLKDNDNDFKLNTPWGNTMIAARWNHLFSNRIFSNTLFSLSNYKFSLDAQQEDFNLKLFSGIKDYTLKSDVTLHHGINQSLKTGVIFTYHQFVPSSVSAKIGNMETENGKKNNLMAFESAVYINEEIDIFQNLRTQLGLRATNYSHIGPFNRYVKDNQNRTIDTITFSKREKIVNYKSLEPRLSIRLLINNSSSLKASYTKNYQYVHMVSISSISLPTDLWVPSTSVVKPQNGNQYSIGYFRNMFNNILETSLEGYYKTFDNQIEYKSGTAQGDDINDNTDNYFTFGKGQSYGIEFLARKNIGKLTGWCGYTLSKTFRKFKEINQGKEFPAKYDRVHDLSCVTSYILNNKWTFSMVFVFATGNCTTIPVSRYLVDGQLLKEYLPRNSYRMEPYHRLDLSVNYQLSKKRKYSQWLNFSIYNVYNRHNPYFIYFSNTGNWQLGHLKTYAKQVSLFPILPSLSWNFEF